MNRRYLIMHSSPYDSKNYPQTYTKFKDRLPDMEIMRKEAAEMAVDSGQCQSVSDSQITLDSTLKAIKIRIDCDNGNNQFRRFTYTEQQIKERKKEDQPSAP
jgi:hypothetical protein